jgi:hypothetical protein
MKTLLITALFTLSCLAQAQEQTLGEPVIQTVTMERARAVHNLTLHLNPKTVRCLVGDYSSSSLKISVNELMGLTRFKQTTRGETAPCINAGSCRFDKTPGGRPLSPALILDASRPTETVPVLVVLTETITLDHANKTCSRELRETVDASVRGLNFHHEDGDYGVEADFENCLQIVGG